MNIKKVLLISGIFLGGLFAQTITSNADTIATGGLSGTSNTSAVVTSGGDNPDNPGGSLFFTQIPDYDFGSLKLGSKEIKQGTDPLSADSNNPLKVTISGKQVIVRDTRGLAVNSDNQYTVTGTYNDPTAQEVKLTFTNPNGTVLSSFNGQGNGVASDSNSFNNAYNITGTADFSNVTHTASYNPQINWTLTAGNVKG